MKMNLENQIKYLFLMCLQTIKKRLSVQLHVFNRPYWAYLFVFSIFFVQLACSSSPSAPLTQDTGNDDTVYNPPIGALQVEVGAARFSEYLSLLQGKRVGLVVNQTSMIGNTHLVDTLLSLGINVQVIFSPEHGFRGDADAGATVQNGKDQATGLPIVSLYGQQKKPSEQVLKNLDILIFDIQDVGVRFYTYISTMHYVMESCARYGKELLVLDRPNPNGDYVDGPVLKPAFTSFVGMHPIPVVHGLTVAELAQMINGEHWLPDSLVCPLTIVSAANYTHATPYSLPVKPSPNLPNDISIRLYPSLCFFEATEVSIGRGTYFPFQVIGYPDSLFGEFSFTPVSIDGMASSPKLQDKLCFGTDLRTESLEHTFTLSYLIEYYKKYTSAGFAKPFFARPEWMDLLTGTDQLRKQIEKGLTEDEIRQSWQTELQAYHALRAKYLLYP